MPRRGAAFAQRLLRSERLRLGVLLWAAGMAGALAAAHAGLAAF